MTNQEFLCSLSNCTIVYVEDDADIRKYIEEFLLRYCKNLYVASNAEDALKLYNQYNPNIMLIDINLPIMSGMELISLIRTNDEDTRIIITTAYTNKEFTLEAVELSLTRYLVKPITSDDLKGALKKAIEQINKTSKDISNIGLGNDFIYNTKDNFVTKNENIINLRKKEKELLDFFIENKDLIITYEMLENEIWQDNIMTLDAIRSQIKNIRHKIYPTLIKNISKTGYKFDIKDLYE